MTNRHGFMVLALLALLSCIDTPLGVMPAEDSGAPMQVAASSSGIPLIAPAMGLCAADRDACSTDSIHVEMRDSLRWQIGWSPPPLALADSLEWRYKIEFDGPGDPHYSTYLWIVRGDTTLTARNRLECRKQEIIDFARSFYIRPEVVVTGQDSRYADRSDRGSSTRYGFPIASWLDPEAQAVCTPPGESGGGSSGSSEPDDAAAVEYLDYVPPADEPPPPDTTTSPPDGTGTTDTTTTSETPDNDEVPVVTIDLRVSVTRDGEVVTDGTVHRGDQLRFSVTPPDGSTNAMKWCWGAYPYGWYVDSNYHPWPSDMEGSGLDSARSNNCLHVRDRDGAVDDPNHYIPYTFDYTIPTDSVAVPGLKRQDGTYWPGFEPKVARIRCTHVSFVIWGWVNGDYTRYLVDETIAIGPADPDNWTGSCSS